MIDVCLQSQDQSYGISYINSGTLTEYNLKCSNSTTCMATHMNYMHIRAQTYMNVRYVSAKCLEISIELEFKSRLRTWLSWLRILVILFSPYNSVLKQYVKNCHD